MKKGKFMMNVTKMGYNLTVDVHGMTVSEVKSELSRLLSTCDKSTHEIDVIHGCHGGTALLNFIRRDFKHPRLARKILTLNNGMTTLVLK